MRRRDFIPAFGAAVAWPLALRAQQAGRISHVAVLAGGETAVDLSETSRLRQWRAWHDELRRLGYIEGRNLVIDKRSPEGDSRRIPELVRRIISAKPDVIFTPRQDATEAVRTATTTIPVVAIASEPVRLGYAASLARPGGNITGFAFDTGAEIFAKRLELLKEAVPGTSRVAQLALRHYWEGWNGNEVRKAAQRVGIGVTGAPLDAPVSEQTYRRAFATLLRDRADAVAIWPQSENILHGRLIAELAIQARLPTLCVLRENADAGGLMAYSVDLPDMFRRAAGYIDLILKGANPATLPFQQPTKFQLIVNLRTAKALGLALSDSLLTRADEVIE
jgi:putative ABC transport system substrate-binding protein